jgi:hypothetical protein
MVTYPVSQWAVGIFSKTPSVNDHGHDIRPLLDWVFVSYEMRCRVSHETVSRAKLTS